MEIDIVTKDNYALFSALQPLHFAFNLLRQRGMTNVARVGSVWKRDEYQIQLIAKIIPT